MLLGTIKIKFVAREALLLEIVRPVRKNVLASEKNREEALATQTSKPEPEPPAARHFTATKTAGQASL